MWRSTYCAGDFPSSHSEWPKACHQFSDRRLLSALDDGYVRVKQSSGQTVGDWTTSFRIPGPSVSLSAFRMASKDRAPGVQAKGLL